MLKTASDLIVIAMTLDRCRILAKIALPMAAAKQQAKKPYTILALFLVILAASFLVTTPYYFEYDVVPLEETSFVSFSLYIF